MDRRRIARELVKVARAVAAKKNDKRDREIFLRHIVNGCRAEAQRINALHEWASSRFSYHTEGLEKYHDLSMIEIEVRELANALEQVEEQRDSQV